MSYCLSITLITLSISPNRDLVKNDFTKSEQISLDFVHNIAQNFKRKEEKQVSSEIYLWKEAFLIKHGGKFWRNEGSCEEDIRGSVVG